MILERLKQYLEIKNITVAAFERSIGMSNASFGKALKTGGAIGSDKLEKIVKVYPDLSAVWLLSGEGNMIMPRKDSNFQTELPTTLDSFAMTLVNRLEHQAEEIGRLKERNLQLEREITSLSSRLTPEQIASVNSRSDEPRIDNGF